MSGGGPTNLGSTYGALGSGNSGLHHQPPQLGGDNIFSEGTGAAAGHLGPSRINGGSMIATREPLGSGGYGDPLKYVGANSAQVSGAAQ